MTRRHDGVDAALVTIIAKSVDGGVQHNLLRLFAGCYEVLISWLGQLFSGNARQPKSLTLRAMESLTFLPFMSEVISPLAELLTQIPRKFGENAYLGPGFEVTSNDFLLPSLAVSAELTNERLSELATLASSLVAPLESHGVKEATGQLAFVSKTLGLMKDEFVSRASFGWIPSASSWDYKYSETIPRDFKYGFEDQAVLELRFEGVTQCRLATDPDGANVARGVTGNGFAIGDEPDLNRVIYFQPQGASQRSHCPEIGVRVRTARLVRRSTDPWKEKGDLVPELTDALIDLIGGPKFEGRNHVVSEDGEPIDPFTIEVRTTTGLAIRRGTIGIPINDMTPLQRRGSGRYPAGAQVSAEAAAANLAILSRLKHPFSFSSPLEYTFDRIARLQKDYDALKASGKEFTKDAAELQFRLRSLDEGLRSPTELDARTIRWTRYFFDCGYRHFVSGDFSKADLGSLAGRFDLASQSTKSDSSRWLVEYHLGFFDTDAMCACISGNLFVPVRVRIG
jgi:hypothetical protein